ncbi:alkaline ceramidase [Clostridia bacterium]|nr:alkaline ceramidase [Clostridia bacterium]
MRAGFGAEVVTPPLGVELAGYGYYLQRRAERVLDELYARALYVEQGGARWLLISCDLLGLVRDVADAVFAALEAWYGLPRAAVMLVNIHTHTGPAIVDHEGCGVPDAPYVATVADSILRACAAAIGDARVVSELTRHFRAIEGDFAYNRADPEGPVDRMVRGLTFTREGAPPIALVSFACHPVFRGRLRAVSADYPGRVNAILAQRGMASLYVNGACGDIDPLIASGEDRGERLDGCAQAICAAFLAGGMPCPLTLESLRGSFALRLATMTREDIRREADGAVRRAGGEAQGGARVARVWERETLARFDAIAAREDISVAAARIGGVWIAALPFETFTETARLVRGGGAGEETIVLGCQEELLGYLPTRGDIARGAYAALESAFLYRRLPAVPGEAERLGAWLGACLGRGGEGLSEGARCE